ncbi:oxidoreductase-like protein [Lindgomyces ingoldianus]|uniref:Oxidoreductase-like protein n=1 Tax=Lindgomyces ingoldianus TaxID=673940 RepID=A0ACB6QBJ3_9PLEO|nr:oxidoreductase-like protein [Lindgomyces ingoldianus]KAF2464414.1 oxidoreductase-like protein [Lindgomyces ingoldianus]
MKAIKVVQAGELAIQDVEIPKLRQGYCLVKTIAVALNPTDFKHLHFIPCNGCTLGCDVAGTVEEVGPDSALKKGDRVAGFVHGANAVHPEDGTYGEYALVREGILFRIPGSLSYEEAASLPVAIATVGMGLWQTLKLPLPTEQVSQKFPVLIYGGSTATGTVAIQMAKMSGLEVITTCSPGNFDLVKSLGASEAFDYHDPDCGEKIRKFTKDKLYHALDCISEEATAVICSTALSHDTSSQPVLYCCTLPVEFPRKDALTKFILGYTAMGEAFFKFADFPANTNDYESTKTFFGLRHHPIEVRDGGLEGIPLGLEVMKAGQVRAKKLVYRIA